MDKERARSILSDLNQNVEEAIEVRTKFLDDNMHLFAEFQIGDKVFNVVNKQRGECVRHYRYWQVQNAFHDKSFSVDCNIKEGFSIDNTSRFISEHPWVLLEDFQNKTDKYLRKLESLART